MQLSDPSLSRKRKIPWRLCLLRLVCGLPRILLIVWAAGGGASAAAQQIEVIPQISHPGAVGSLAIAGNKSRFASSYGSDVQLWDVPTRRLLRSVHGDLTPTSPDANTVNTFPQSRVAISPDGTHVVLITNDGIEAWNFGDGGKVTFKKSSSGNSATLQSAVFANSSTVLTSSIAGVMSWNVETGDSRVLASHACLDILSISSDQSRFLCGGRGYPYELRDATNANVLAHLQSGSASARRLIGGLSQDNSRAFSICDSSYWSFQFQTGPCLLKVWNAMTGALLLDRQLDHGAVGATFSQDGTQLIVLGDSTLEVWDSASGAVVAKEQLSVAARVDAAAFAPDGVVAAAGSGLGEVILHKAGDKAWSKPLGSPAVAAGAMAYSPDGKRFITGERGGGLRLWDATTGMPIWSTKIPLNPDISRMGWPAIVLKIEYARDGSAILVHSSHGIISIHNPENGELLHQVICSVSGYQIEVVAAFVDQQRIVTGNCELPSSGEEAHRRTLIEWDLLSGKPISDFGGFNLDVSSVAISDDAKRLVSDGQGGIKVWSLETGAKIEDYGKLKRRTDAGDVACDPGVISPNAGLLICPLLLRNEGAGVMAETLWDLRSKTFLRQIGEPWQIGAKLAGPTQLDYDMEKNWKESSQVLSIPSFSADGYRVHLVRSYGGAALEASTWDVGTDTRLSDVQLDPGTVGTVIFSPDDTRILQQGADGATRIADGEGIELARLVGSSDGRYIAITRAGFFSGSTPVDQMVAIVQGFRTYSVSQVFEKLYRPDLVVEKLKGDPLKDYAAAAHELNLEQILRSGNAPLIELAGDPVRVGAAVDIKGRLVDQGGGIGKKIIWRVDGSVMGSVDLPAAEDAGERVVPIQRTLTLTRGAEHSVDIVAYNRSELLASEPRSIKISAEGSAPTNAPRLFLLAVGISKYAYPALELNLAAKDAASIALALSSVGHGFLTDVKAYVVPETEATVPGIQSAFDKIRADPNLTANDIFVLFLAGHGRYDGSQFYFIPQDFDPRSPPEGKNHTLAHDAIDQDLLQRWIASVEVNKRIVILDTCESGKGTGSLIRALDLPRTTAWEQLQHATGDNLLAAAGETAFESNTLGHGLLTYSILDSLSYHRPGDDQAKVNWDIVAAQALDDVPELSKRIFGEVQEPIRKSSLGRPIVLGYRRFKLEAPTLVTSSHHYVLIKDTSTLTESGTASTISRVLPAPMIVDIIGYNKNKTLAHISWGGGVGDGWVRVETLEQANDGPVVH
jgi:WD40 repeat protein